MTAQDQGGDDQLELIPAPRSRATKPRPTPDAAAERPVARVAVDTGLIHLDRPFDYLVPADLHDAVVPGCRVKVRFAGQQVDGFVLERVDETAHEGRLAFLLKVVSSEPVLSPKVLTLARQVADRYAGTLGDVLRLAVPPRHARTEKAASPERSTSAEPDPVLWADHVGGVDLLRGLRDGESPRVVWSALPDPDPAVLAAHAALATVRSGRGAVVCVPDVRDVERWAEVFTAVLGESFVVLTAAQEPAARYRSFLALARGAVPVVLGTRAAAYAPVRDLGLCLLWDEGDDLYAEPRAPYPHTREVLALRSDLEGAALVLAGHGRTAEAQSLVESGWCVEVVGDLAARRQTWPRTELTDGSDHGGVPVRLPRAVFAAMRAADGPVLVQVPRRGYRTSLSCQRCRTPARCEACEGPLQQLAAGTAPVCRWCGVVADPWECRECAATQLRAPVVGQLRTAEEFARAFADREVVTSGGATVLDRAPEGRSIVLSTPGAEPRGPYALVVLLDTWLMLGRDDVRVLEESHRRWFNALALAPGGRAVVVGEPSLLQALVRADPAGFAERELADRRDTHLPPVGRLATIDADPELLTALSERPWTEHTEVLGPVPTPGQAEGGERLILRAPRREGADLARLLHAAAAERSAAKLSVPRIQVDPARF